MLNFLPSWQFIIFFKYIKNDSDWYSNNPESAEKALIPAQHKLRLHC